MGASLPFAFHVCRFEFRARATLSFPAGQSGNRFRGAFGLALRQVASAEVYHAIFEPQSTDGPSGFQDTPRPFVFRTAHLEHAPVERGETFHIGVNLFHVADPPVAEFGAALAKAGEVRWEATGSVHRLVTLDLAEAEPASQVRVRFVTPTEIKVKGKTAAIADFAALIRRVRDRVSLLRSLYGPGALDMDFSAFGALAESVRIEQEQLTAHNYSRTSGRTGQTHPIGGLTGEVVYSGDLGPFLPFLRAAYYTGVGRHTVWGNGQLEVAQVSKR